MLPGVGTPELVVIAVVALLVVGPKDLPIMLRKLGQFTAKMRGLASEFRASFDEMARQSELDELRREVEALREGRFADAHKPDVESHMRDIDTHMSGPNSGPNSGFDPHHAWDGSYADTGGAPLPAPAPAEDEEPELPFGAPHAVHPEADAEPELPLTPVVSAPVKAAAE